MNKIKVENNNRPYKISLRLNEIEYGKLHANILKAGMHKSEFIRMALTKTNVVSKMTEEERSILRNLLGIATNLNQLAHKANANNEFSGVALDVIKSRLAIDIIIEKYNSR